MIKTELNITIGDNNNKEYRRDIKVEVSGTTALLIRDRCRTADPDDYNKAWEDMCDEIDRQYRDLPYEWYVYSIER